MLQNEENNGTEEMGLVTPTPDPQWRSLVLEIGYAPLWTDRPFTL